MSDIITTLHPQGDNVTNLYPNVKLENIIDTAPEDSGKVLGIGEDGKVKPVTIDIPEPVQVNDSRITLTQGGVEKGFFTLNQAEDATIDLDASSTGESGSSMYATNSAISEGVPAHIEAANPIKVGDTISQLYFNTQQDIGDYLANIVDWGDGKKVMYVDDISVYPLLTAASGENEAGFRGVKVGDYIYGLKIKADYTPGDGKVDPELNNWLANMLVFSTSVNLFSAGPLGGDQTSSMSLKAVKSGAEYILNIENINGSATMVTRIYSSTNGFESAYSWDQDEHAYIDGARRNKEFFILDMNDTESANWNGVFFGAVSNLGGIVLSAIKVSGSVTDGGSNVIGDSYTYALTPNMFGGGIPTIYYSSSLIITGDSIIKAGWQVTADQAVALSKPEKVTSVNSDVSKIASSELNWVPVPKVFGSIYQDNILGTDEVKVNDILVDTSGTLGKVKGFSEESFKNQHPENSFNIGDEIPANGYLYIDTSVTPDLSKIDWSGFNPNSGSDGIYPLAPLEAFAFMQFSPDIMLAMIGTKFNKPVYFLVLSEDAIYIQVDPSDSSKLVGSALLEDIGGSINEWHFSDRVTHEGSIFKIPLGNEAAITITDVNDQDIWGAYISKDGKWIEDAPTVRTKVSCEALRQLPTNYENLDGVPIIKSEHILNSDYSEYQFIPANYRNKYIQDPTGIIYFCDGDKLYELKGGNSASNFTVNITAQSGLRTYNTTADDTSYSTSIGLSDINLGNYSQVDGDQVFGKRSGNYGWINLPSQSATPSQIQAGSGIDVSGNTVSLTSYNTNYSIDNTSNGLYVMTRGGSTMSEPIGWGRVNIPRAIKAGTGLTSAAYDNITDEISLSQDVQDKLARIPGLPTNTGEYALICTVTDGVARLAWTPTK